ncbi:hypothetical protein G4L39_01215 [Limisphaera ngatamarikiensis]|uniref:Uncharacterized protein n=1 Tax=Limisphaera ngatamarikiensis TaxID=1324935 RepID=A0A6M1RD51_9BACT|nr:hypothetical protein [Limisphaera ngatamarikiensis]NGO38018.1 hypothetical protein [Limisphaera ngatamarikiensis]
MPGRSDGTGSGRPAEGAGPWELARSSMAGQTGAGSPALAGYPAVTPFCPGWTERAGVGLGGVAAAAEVVAGGVEVGGLARGGTGAVAQMFECLWTCQGRAQGVFCAA